MPLPPRGTVIQASDAPFQPLEEASGRTVSILGYGNQGRAHALNLRDSGAKVIVGGRPDSDARARAEQEGFETFDLADAARTANLVVIALPEDMLADMVNSVIEGGIVRSGPESRDTTYVLGRKEHCGRDSSSAPPRSSARKDKG